MHPDTIPALRELLERERPSGNPVDRIPFGISRIDEVTGGGLARQGVHEVYPSAAVHFGAATGFAALLALKAAGAKPILWARQQFLDRETGSPSASGLAELGLDPARLVFVRAPNGEGVLRAGEQALRCAALGAVIIELWGEPKTLDFTASRRLSLASAKSDVPIFMLRAAASPGQSAAITRWSVESLPSRALEANAPGLPAFKLNLLRHRGGTTGHEWRVEWNRDRKCFQDPQESVAPVSSSVVSLSLSRSAAATQEWRRAG